MDFVKLKSLPRPLAVSAVTDDSRYFKAFKKRYAYDTATGGDVTCVKFNPGIEGNEIAVACGTRLQILNLGQDAMEVNHNWAKHKERTTCIDYRSDGQLLVAGDQAGHANIYSLASEHGILRRLRGHEGAILSTCFGFHKDELWTTGKDTTVKLWDVPTGQIKQSFLGHDDLVKSLVVINDNLTVSGGYDGRLIIWDCRQGTLVSQLSHGSQVDALALFPSTTMLVSVGTDTMKVWNLTNQSESTCTPSRHSRAVTGISMSPTGDFLWTSSLDGSVKVRDTASWEVVHAFNSDKPITALAVKGETLITGDEQGSIACRQRRVQAPVQAAASGERYFSVGPAPKSESPIDFMLRKFEYKKLVDYLAEEKSCLNSLGLGALDELVQRGALEAAVRDRSSAEVSAFLVYLSRVLVAYPSYTQLVIHAIHTVLDTNPKAEVADTVKTLLTKVETEVSLQESVWPLIGAIETVMLLR